MVHDLTVAALALWLLAAVHAVVNLLTTPRLRDSEPDEAGPLVSVVIPARNEERAIGQTVRAFLSQTWRSLEIIVVDDQSDDSTARIVGDLAKQDNRVRLVSGTDRPEGWLGKPWALEQGGREAEGEWILFVDADLTYGPKAIASLMAEAARHPDFAMFFVMPRLIAEGFWENVMMPALPCGLYLAVPIALANRGRAVQLALGGGTGNLVRAEAWRTIGGHERLHNAVVDDVGMARMLRRFGFRTRMVRAEDHASIRMYHGLGEIVHGFTKNAYSVFAGSLWKAVVFAGVASIVHLIPWVVAIGGVAGLFGESETAIAFATLGMIVATRLFLYRSLGFSLAAALLVHPLEIALTLYIFGRSTFVVGILGNPTWRGRGYPARVTTFGEPPR
jgi:chlorobactene glucosyltransferase